MANDAGYPLPLVNDPEGYKCVTIKIPDDVNHIRAFWGHLFQLARWWSWERDAEHNGSLAAQRWAKIWAESRNIFDETGGTCDTSEYCTELTEEQITQYIEQYILKGGIVSCYDDESESEEMPNIVHIGGEAYLEELCGCNETQFYKLQAATVSIDPTSGVAKIDAPSAKDLPTNPYAFDTGADYQLCTASAAAAAILSYAASFYEDVATIFQIGFDLFSEAGDELYNVLQAGYETVTGGILPDWYGVSAEVAANALASSETFTAVRDRYVYTGPITRAQLRDIVSQAPVSVNNVAVRHILQDWASTVIIDLLNDKIQAMVASCVEAGGEVPDYLPTTSYLWEYEGDDYQVYDFAPNVYFDTEADWMCPVQPEGFAGGAYAIYTVHNTLSGYTRVFIDDEGMQKADPNATTGLYFHGRGSSGKYQTMAEQIVGLTTNAISTTLTTPDFGTGFRVISPSGGTLTLQRFLLILPILVP